MPGRPQKRSAILDLVVYEYRDNGFKSSAYGWIWAVRYCGDPLEKGGEETPMDVTIDHTV